MKFLTEKTAVQIQGGREYLQQHDVKFGDGAVIGAKNVGKARHRVGPDIVLVCVARRGAVGA